jgi:hypothetical protein
MMRISEQQTEFVWLMKLAGSFVAAIVAVVCFAYGYEYIGAGSSACAIAASWSSLRPCSYPDVFLLKDGVQVVRKAVVTFVPFSRVIEIEPYGRRYSLVRITFNSDEGQLRRFVFIPSSEFGILFASVKVKELLWEKALSVGSASQV